MQSETNTDQLKWQEAPRAEAARFYKRVGKSVRISRNDYAIVACQAISLNGKECHGVISLDGFIYVNIMDGEAMETLLHEIVHGEVVASGLRQTEGWSHDVEEIVCEVISRSIAHNFNLQKKSAPAPRPKVPRRSRLR